MFWFRLFTLLIWICIVDTITAEESCTEVIESCHICSSEESLKYLDCKSTGYIEILKCDDKKIISKTCNSEVVEGWRLFWKFEGTMIVMTILSVAFVLLRMRKLDDEQTDKINKQLSSI